jgi:zinc protease
MPAAFPITTKTLENGLTVVIEEDHRAPLVTVDVQYAVGASDDPDGRSGLAHLVEHVLLARSATLSLGEAGRLLDAAGAIDRNANTSSDRTEFYATVPTNAFALALFVERDRMLGAPHAVDAATLLRERDVVANERRQTFVDKPFGRAGEISSLHLFPTGDRYGRTVIGSESDLALATVDELSSFVRAHYTPRNAVLLVGGDVSATQALAEIRAAFGAIPNGPPPPLRRRLLPLSSKHEGRVVYESAVESARIYVTWPAPGDLEADDTALRLLAQILGGGPSSRLRRRLVDSDAVAHEVSCEIDANELRSSLVVRATIREGHGTDEPLAAIDAELAKIIESGVDAAELARAKAHERTRLLFASDAQKDRLSRIGTYVRVTGEPEAFARDLGRFDAVDERSLREAARRWLRREHRIVGTFRPTKGAPAGGRLASEEIAP